MRKTTSAPTYVTAEEFAVATQLNVHTIWRLVRQGEIRAEHFGRSVRIPVEELHRYRSAA